MPAYARGAKAWGICDRTGFRYRLHDLVWEFQNGVKTGLRVGNDVSDKDHPQNFLGRLKINDPQALQDPRPDYSPGRGVWGWDPVGNSGVALTLATGRITVTGG